MNALLDTALRPLLNLLHRSGLSAEDVDYRVIRASMVIIFLFFGYQKWWAYEAERLVPFISNGPLISWMYPAFGYRGASWFLGALGSTVTFIMTVTIIPFMPDGWDPVAGFPAMTGNVPFLMKDVVLLAASIYLLRQDVLRVSKG